MRDRRWLGLLLLIPIGVGLFWWSGQEHEAAEERAAEEAAAEAVENASSDEADPSEDEASADADAGVAPLARTPVRLSPVVVRTDPSSEAGALSGRVLGWASNRPVPDAELTFAHGETTRTVRTDAEGEFQLVPDEPGTYVLALATAQGYLPFAPEWGQSPIRFEARAGVRVEGVTVTLVDALSTRVEVVRADDTPVAGATVRVFGLDRGERALAPMQDEWTTGEDGAVDIQAPDWAVLEASHPEHGTGRGAIDTAAQVSHRLTVRLLAEVPEDRRADATIAGVVTSEAGEPIEGALVVASAGEVRNEGLHPPLEGLTDGDGRFSLTGADRVPHALVVTADGYARASEDGVTPGDAVNVTLAPEGRLRVRVLGEEGEALGAWTVIVERSLGELEWDTLASESGYGDAEILVRGVPRGACRVLAVSPGHSPSAPVSATASASPSLTELRLARGGTIVGRVVSADGAPLDHARATVEGRLGSGATAVPIASSALSDEDGRFELTGVRRGLTSIVVWAADHHGRVRSGLMVADDPVDAGTVDLTPVEDGEEPRLELAGIGAVLSAEGDILRIGRVIEGGGAAEAGLGPGDAILAIEGAPVGGLGFGGCIERIRGPEGTVVLLTVRRAEAEEPEVLRVPRRRIRA